MSVVIAVLLLLLLILVGNALTPQQRAQAGQDMGNLVGLMAVGVLWLVRLAWALFLIAACLAGLFLVMIAAFD